ncbi:MAG: urease subunit beta [Segetibacter sp.]
MIPEEYILAADNIECNAGRPTIQITVVNTGDRPVQVGSHFHFFEVNKQMDFDREKVSRRPASSCAFQTRRSLVCCRLCLSFARCNLYYS